MKMEAARAKAAREVYERYWESYLAADVESFASTLDEQFQLIGTSETEICHNKADGIRFAKAQAREVIGHVEKRNRRLDEIAVDHMLLINEQCDIFVLSGEEWSFYSRLRISTLLRENEEGWKVLQQHGSVPDMRVEEGETLAIDRISRENLELKDAISRATVELQQKNHDLQVEAALEKVRAVAMGMQKPREMLKVCRVIAEQLQKFGVEQIRNVQIVIVNDDNLTYQNFQFFAAYDRETFEVAARYETPIVDAMIASMLKSPNAFFTGDLQGKELTAFRQYRKDIGQFPDPLLDEVDSVNYHFFSFGRGGLGITLYRPLNDVGLEIFKRFHNVFSLAYRRFLDIQNAEAQARDAQIEAALERVRSASMAMHKTTELHKVISTVFGQLRSLQLPLDACYIDIFEPNNWGLNVWVGNEKDSYPEKLPSSYIDHPVYNKTKEARLKKEPFFSLSLDRNEVERFYQHLATENHIPEDRYQIMLKLDTLNMSVAVSEYAALSVYNARGIAYSEDQNEIIRRFSRVFEQAYTRFLDIEKAEAQAREAQIELALERIRAHVTGMQESSDLFDIVVNMRREFIALGHEADYFWHMRWLPDRYEMSMTSESGDRLGMVVTVPKWVHDNIPELCSWEKSDAPLFVLALDAEKGWDYIDKMNTYGSYEVIDPHAPSEEDIQHIGGLTFVIARTSHGEIGFSLAGQVPHPPEESTETLVRFAKVFDLAYMRFEDLKEAEQQAALIREERDRLEKALEELKSTQTQLVHAEKMASLGELTAGIAHEIQNPLNFVNNFSEVSKELLEEMEEEVQKGDLEEVKAISRDVIQNLEKISHHGKRADAIVKGMLAHSRSNSGQKVLTDLSTLADEYLRLAYHGLRAKDKSFNANFNLEADENLPKVEVVAQDIGRVLLNLINNAFHAVASKAAEQKDASYKPQVLVNLGTQDDLITIVVKDNGNGVPESIKDKIFQPFFTTKPAGEGTGLGLSLSYDIITKGHGGTLTLKTNTGEGSEFIITLPKNKANAPIQ